MPNKAKTKATNLPVPQTDAEAEKMIAELGALQVALASDQADHDKAVAELEGVHGAVVNAFKERSTAITEGLSMWASANRERLTKGGKTKTVQLATGTILWRDGRFSVKHKGLKIEDVVGGVMSKISELRLRMADLGDLETEERDELKKKMGVFRGFLRPKTELNKDAMLAARDAAEQIPGVTIPRGAEEFAVEPLASQIRGDT